jgi:hypothetical protein
MRVHLARSEAPPAYSTTVAIVLDKLTHAPRNRFRDQESSSPEATGKMRRRFIVAAISRRNEEMNE